MVNEIVSNSGGPMCNRSVIGLNFVFAVISALAVRASVIGAPLPGSSAKGSRMARTVALASGPSCPAIPEVKIMTLSAPPEWIECR
jgi:hypothetical protein